MATPDEVLTHNHPPTPGRSIGSEGVEEDEDPSEPPFPRLVEPPEAQFAKSARLETEIRSNLRGLHNGS